MSDTKSHEVVHKNPLSSEPVAAIYNGIFSFIERNNILVLVLWVLVGVVAAIVSEDTMDKLDPYAMEYPGIRAYDELTLLKKYFPESAVEKELIILVQDDEGKDVTSSPIVASAIARIFERAESKKSYDDFIIGMPTNYWMLQRAGLGTMAEKFVSLDRSATFGIWPMNSTHITRSNAFIKDIREIIEEEIDEVPSNFKFVITGDMVLAIDLSMEALEDETNIELRAGPLTVLMFAIILRSVRLIVFPIVGMVFALALTAVFVNFLASVTSVSLAVFGITSAVNVALAIDYCLFILGRFTE